MILLKEIIKNPNTNLIIDVFNVTSIIQNTDKNEISENYSHGQGEYKKSL